MNGAVAFPLDLPELEIAASGGSRVRRTILPSGVRILSEQVPGSQSATVGFCASRRFFSTRWKKVMAGIGGSYLAWLAILVAAGPETLMWLPVIILVGIPFTAPVLMGAWVGSGFLIADR